MLRKPPAFTLAAGTLAFTLFFTVAYRIDVSLKSFPSHNIDLSKEQAGFRRGKSTMDQVILLTQNIDDSFEAKKSGVVFVNLTTVYDTVWHRDLTCKLLRLLLDNHTVKIIMELAQNRRFTLTTGDSKQSRLRSRKNGVSQISVLVTLLLIYTYDLPFAIFRKFAYADNLALFHSSKNWKDLEGL